MTASNPIGVFDSGLGGLSILREIRTRLPGESLLYVADSRYLPYGNKSEDFITARTLAICDFLMTQQARALVVACNTATAAAISMVRAKYAVPVIGIEPAIKPATAVTRSGIVGILATASTLQSRKYAELVERFGRFAQVISQPCSGLVELVEAGDFNGPETQRLLRSYIQPLLDAGADTLVLGCTHYPFLIDSIRAIAGEGIDIIDPGEAVARRVVELLEPSAAQISGALRCVSSGDPKLQQKLISGLLGHAVVVEALPEAYCTSAPKPG